MWTGVMKQCLNYATINELVEVFLPQGIDLSDAQNSLAK